jgi:hypothetical protein
MPQAVQKVMHSEIYLCSGTLFGTQFWNAMFSAPMTKTKKLKKVASRSTKTGKQRARPIELDHDAWPKFEALVKSAAKMGHVPHKSLRASSKLR